MRCCNAEVTTPFCPLCGTHLVDGPLGSLLVHINNRLKIQKAALRRRQEDPSSGYKDESQVLVRSITKWEEWANALADTIHPKGE